MVFAGLLGLLFACGLFRNWFLATTHHSVRHNGPVTDLLNLNLNDPALPAEKIYDIVANLFENKMPEGRFLEYKSESGPKFLEAVASFSNSPGGGLIILGVKDDADGLPQDLCGFPGGKGEAETNIRNRVISCVDPTPSFSVRCGPIPESQAIVAIVRVEEGVNPPYMLSRQQANRIYVRDGASKREANRFELLALVERGQTGLAGQLESARSRANRLNKTRRPFDLHRISPGPEESFYAANSFYRLICVPVRSKSEGILDSAEEELFDQFVSWSFSGDLENLNGLPPARHQLAWERSMSTSSIDLRLFPDEYRRHHMNRMWTLDLDRGFAFSSSFPATKESASTLILPLALIDLTRFLVFARRYYMHLQQFSELYCTISVESNRDDILKLSIPNSSIYTSDPVPSDALRLDSRVSRPVMGGNFQAARLIDSPASISEEFIVDLVMKWTAAWVRVYKATADLAKLESLAIKWAKEALDPLNARHDRTFSGHMG